MALPNVFQKDVTDTIIGRIQQLTPDTTPLWGSMSAPQMLAHCNVTYEMVYDNIHPKPNFFMKFILKSLVKNKVVTEAPYGQNGQTAPQFIISGSRDFNKEKQRLIDFIEKTQKLGANEFEQKESHSFGKLSSNEWNNMFYKHLDHHLRQFGV